MTEIIARINHFFARYLDLKNSIMVEVAERFAAEGISLPFPQLDVRVSKV